MTIERTFNIPGLATVKLDTTDSLQPALQIILAPEYDGDLIELDRQTEDGDDSVYLSCNHITARGNILLAAFMEELNHHVCAEKCDQIHDDDCEPDCKRKDHPTKCSKVIDIIEEALYETDDTPRNFRRPADGLYSRLVMLIMPQAPERHVVMGYGKLQPRMRLHHHLVGVLMVIGFISLVYLQDHYLPWMKYSVISGFLALAELVGVTGWWGVLLFVVVLNLLRRFGDKSDPEESSLSSYTVGFFSKAAVFEEQAFREGSENWNFQQRLRSCVAFGAIHMVNLIYPLASILPLTLGGAFFMAMYLRKLRQTGSRRAAVLRASVWHRVYNRIALTVFVASLFLWFGNKAFGMFAAFVLLFIIGYVIDQSYLRRDRSDSVESARMSINK